MPEISPNAIVTDPGQLAEDVVVGPFAYIGPDVRIGPGGRVDANAMLDGDVEIGPGTHIYPFAMIGQPSEPGQPGGRVRIGPRNIIREHAVITAGSDPDGPGTCIGSDCLVMIGCGLEADVQVADQVILGPYTQLARGSRVETFVRASAFTGTRTGATIGAYTFTSGYAGIDRDAPPYAMVQGFPFRVRGVNVENLKRCGFSDQSIARLKEAFRSLFNGIGSGPVDPARLAQWEAQADSDEHLGYLLSFLRRQQQACQAADAHDASAGTSVREGE